MRYGKIVFDKFDPERLSNDDFFHGRHEGIGFAMKKKPEIGDEEFTLSLPSK